MSASPYRRPLRAPPRARRRRSAWVRPALAAIIVAMLPFAWSEDSTCDRLPRPPVSGYEILFGKHWEPGAIFLGVLALAVAMGFLARFTYRFWLRLAAEVVAGLSGLVTFTMCMMMMHYGREDQPLVYPAAWIGSMAAAVLAFQAWWASGAALRRLVERRRARRALAKLMAAGAEPKERGAGVRLGAGAALEDREAAAEAEALAEEEATAARREL